MKLFVGTDIFNWKEPQLLEGPGSIRKLPELIKSKGIGNILVVTDKGLTGLGLLDGLYEELEKAGVKYTVFDGVQPNPTIDNIEACKDEYFRHSCEAVIAFGGGSPMDCAKMAAARVTNPSIPVKKMRGLLKIRKPLPPLFAVPTTAGTGSEVTLAAVFSDPATHEKSPATDPKLRPGYAVLDPELTVGLPPHITSTTGMDALTHAVEAYIGRCNVGNTEEYAKKAIKLIFDNIKTAYEDGKNIEARGNMLKASFYAGMAFTRAYVGYVHAIGHNIGGVYGVPHGLAMAVILPHVLDYYGIYAYDRLADLADVAGLETAGLSTAAKAQLFVAKIREMNKEMNIPEHIDGILEKDISTIAQRALKEGNPQYPVPRLMGFDECVELIKRIGNIQ
jgi:alcohol dehydrogenase class IV